MKAVNRFYAKRGITPYKIRIFTGTFSAIIMGIDALLIKYIDGFIHSKFPFVIGGIAIILGFYGIFKGSCPSCGAGIKSIGRYCPHCGENTDTFKYWYD